MLLPYSEFIRMTWSQFIYAYTGFSRESFKNRFEGARLVSFMIASVNRDPKKPFPNSPEKFLPLPTDKDFADDKKHTADWAREMKAKMKRISEQFKQQ